MSTACKFSILIWSMGKWFEIKVFVKADWLQLNTTLFCSWYSQLMFFLNSWIFKHFPEKAFKKMAMMNGAVMGKQAQQPPPPAKPGGIEDLAQVNIFQFRGEYMAQESHLPPSVSESWSSYITFSKDFTQTPHPQYIDSSKSECLNEADDHPYQHCLTRFVCSEHQLDIQCLTLSISISFQGPLSSFWWFVWSPLYLLSFSLEWLSWSFCRSESTNKFKLPVIIHIDNNR